MPSDLPSSWSYLWSDDLPRSQIKDRHHLWNSILAQFEFFSHPKVGVEAAGWRDRPNDPYIQICTYHVLSTIWGHTIILPVSLLNKQQVKSKKALLRRFPGTGRSHIAEKCRTGEHVRYVGLTKAVWSRHKYIFRSWKCIEYLNISELMRGRNVHLYPWFIVVKIVRFCW